MIQSRDSLARLRASFKEVSNENESGSASNEDVVDPQIASQNLADLRERWASWAAQKADQTVAEVEGLRSRLRTYEKSSRTIGLILLKGSRGWSSRSLLHCDRSQANSSPSILGAITLLRSYLTSAEPSAEEQSIVVLESADEIIVAMEAVLDKMLELEDYAELVNIVRQLIEQQENLQQQTEEEQKANVLDLLK